MLCDVVRLQLPNGDGGKSLARIRKLALLRPALTSSCYWAKSLSKRNFVER